MTVCVDDPNQEDPCSPVSSSVLGVTFSAGKTPQCPYCTWLGDQAGRLDQINVLLTPSSAASGFYDLQVTSGGSAIGLGFQAPPGQSAADPAQSNRAPVQVPVAGCPIPINFRSAAPAVCKQSTGTLSFVYAWDSSSGNMADLAKCTIQETVTYPNNGVLPSPPFPANSPFPNPTIIPANTTPPTYNGNGASTDNQLPPSGQYVPPYTSGTTFTATQNYQYNCACQNTTDFTVFSGFRGIQIVREVTNPSGTWLYQITKSKASCSIPISPQ